MPIRHSTLLRSALLLLFLGTSARLADAEDIKKIHPTGYVTDLAGVVSPQTKARLEALCTELDQKAGAQMAIVTVHSLEGESVEEYAVDLFKQLGVGGKQSNRGVLLLISPDERKYRTEVGYGLEPIINDARAGDAGRAMVPFLRQRNYDAAIETGAWQLAKYVADDRGVSLSAPEPPRHSQPVDSGRGSRLPNIPFWLIFGVIGLIFHLIGAAWRRLTGRTGRAGRGGGWWIGPTGGGFGGGSGGYDSGGGFGGFDGGSSGGGGASGDW